MVSQDCLLSERMNDTCGNDMAVSDRIPDAAGPPVRLVRGAGSGKNPGGAGTPAKNSAKVWSARILPLALAKSVIYIVTQKNVASSVELATSISLLRRSYSRFNGTGGFTSYLNW